MSHKMTLRRSVDEHGHVHFILSRFDKDCFEVVLSNGYEGTSLRWLEERPLGYFYTDEDEAISNAWRQAIAERQATRAAMHAAEMLRRQTDRSKVFHGCSVDLSCAETFDALSGCESRAAGDRVEIKFRGDWWRLSRTDLKDDVCTSGPHNSVEGHRQAAKYGARLKVYPHGRFFAVVDSYSDG